jgi:hypothetical protein
MNTCSVSSAAHDRPAQQRVARVTVSPARRLGVFGRLAGEVILDLGDGGRIAVQ